MGNVVRERIIREVIVIPVTGDVHVLTMMTQAVVRKHALQAIIVQQDLQMSIKTIVRQGPTARRAHQPLLRVLLLDIIVLYSLLVRLNIFVPVVIMEVDHL